MAAPKTKVIWHYKGDLRYKGDVGWTPYSTEESDKIEEAYQAGNKTVKLNDKYKISFEKMFQFRIDDTTKQRDIKREETVAKKQKTAHKESLLGKKVFVLTELTSGGSVNVIGVFAEKEDAVAKKDKKKKAKESSFFDVHEELIK